MSTICTHVFELPDEELWLLVLVLAVVELALLHLLEVLLLLPLRLPHLLELGVLLLDGLVGGRGAALGDLALVEELPELGRVLGADVDLKR